MFFYAPLTSCNFTKTTVKLEVQVSMSNVLHNTPAKNYIIPWLWYIHSIIYPWFITFELFSVIPLGYIQDQTKISEGTECEQETEII